MPLPIVYYGNPILRTPCKEIATITPDILRLIEEMVETMDNNNGAGIAAPQVGKSIRLFVLRNYEENEKKEIVLSEPKVYINPKILNYSQETCMDFEGCLSIPGVREEVERPVAIRIEALDAEGKPFVEEVAGYNARVRMHENDHLNGVLFIDRLSPGKKKKLIPVLKKIKEKYAR